MPKKNYSLQVTQETAKALLEIKAVAFNAQEPFRFTSGLLSPIYIDNRLIISYPKLRNKIIDFYVQVIKQEIGLDQVDLISGTSTAAIAQAAWISQKLSLPMVYVRGKKKEHGQKKQIEGVVKPGQKTVVIEDLISTGQSFVNNLQAIREAEGIVNFVVTTVHYQMQAALASEKKHQVKILYLTDYKQIVETAVKLGKLKPEHQALVLDWQKDPQGWGRRAGFE